MKIDWNNPKLIGVLIVLAMVLLAYMSMQYRGCTISSSNDEIQALRDSVAVNKQEIKYLNGRVDELASQADTLKMQMESRADRIITIEKRISVPFVPKMTNAQSSKRFLIDESNKGIQ